MPRGMARLAGTRPVARPAGTRPVARPAGTRPVARPAGTRLVARPAGTRPVAWLAGTRPAVDGVARAIAIKKPQAISTAPAIPTTMLRRICPPLAYVGMSP